MSSVLASHPSAPSSHGDSPASPFADSAPLDSASWCSWFRANSARNRPIPWHVGADLQTAERESVAASIQTFQLGERGTGRHLLAKAEDHAAKTGDRDYPEALQLLFTEEHRHAGDLGRFLDLAGIPRIEHDPVNGVFRRLRHLAGLELSIAVLFTAELLALVYYSALRRATRSATLRALCAEILRDEVAHVRFQAQRLAILRRGRSFVSRWLTRLWQRTLFAATSLVVWQTHRRALRAGGLNFRGYWQRAQRQERNLLDVSLGTSLGYGHGKTAGTID
jgi:hypothetical protein